MVVDVPIRIYYRDANNRVTKLLFDKERVHIRFNNYLLFLKEYKGDLLSVKAYDKVGDLYFKLGFFGVLSKKRGAKSFFLKAMRVSNSFKKKIFYFLFFLFSFFGRWFFVIIMRFLRVIA